MPLRDPEVGVRAVVKDMSKFLRDMDQVLNKTQQTSHQMGRAVVKQADSVTQGGNKIIEMFKNMSTQGTGSISGLGASLLGLLGPLAGIVSAVGAVLGAVLGLGALGIKGSMVSSVEESFSRMAQSAQLSAETMLDSMHKAAAGMVTDFDLMRETNLLLSGLTGETATKMADSVSLLLKIARVQARATGGDMEYFFDSLVRGIKRAEPRLIDNTNLLIKVGQATRSFSEQMDVTTQNMTVEQKSQAILNEVLRVGTQSLLIYGDANEEIQTKMADLNYELEKGKITQEEYNTKLIELGNSINSFTTTTPMERLQQLRTSFSQLVNTIGQAIAPTVGAWLSFIESLAAPIMDFVNNVAPAFAAVFTVLAPLISGVGEVIGGLLRPLLNFVGGVLTGIAKGVIWIGGAIATAILYVANKLIFPAVISVLETLASWLEGHSPPVAGPLKDLDKGAAAVMEAWLSGFTGVSLDPVAEVVADVNSLMGEVTGFNRDQVEIAIKSLDEALRPFDERLRLVKATFEELKEPIDAAFRAIDRQMETAVKAMLRGDTEAAALVRQLDAQRQALQEYTDAQQEAIDNAEIQLSYVKAQQALEREILEIQQERLGPAEKEEKIKAAKAKKAKKEKEGEAAPTIAKEGGVIPGGQAPAFGMEKNVQKFIDEALAGGGVGALLKEQQALAEESTTKIGTLGGRISKGLDTLGTRIGDAIKRGLGIAVEDPELQKKLEAFGISATGFISTGIDQSTLSGSIARLVNRVGTGIDFAIAVGNLSSKALTILTDDISRGDPKLKEALVALVGHVATSDQLKFINTTLGQGFTNQFMTAISDDKNPDSLATKLGQFWDPKSKTWKENPDKAVTSVSDIVKEGFVDKSGGSLDEFDRRVLTTTNTNLPGALRTVDGDLTTLLVNPFGVAVTKTTEHLTSLDTSLDNARTQHIDPYVASLKNITTEILRPGGLKDALIALSNAPPPELPPPPAVPGLPKEAGESYDERQNRLRNNRASGGPAIGGQEYIIGEYGPERLRLPPGVNGWIDSTSQMMHQFSQDPLRSLFPSLPYPSMALGGNTTTNDSSTSYGDIIFNGVRDSTSAMRQFAMLRMMKR